MQPNTPTPHNYMALLQQAIGKECVSLGDLEWDMITTFLATIPTKLQQVDFLDSLANLPDDGVANGIIVNPQRHNRNQNTLLAPLGKTRSQLLTQHFDLEHILDKANKVNDQEALSYLWEVLRSYSHYHNPTC